MWKTYFKESPLISRAWVVQERILARRVIHFGRRQLGWECHEQEHCEMFPQGFPPVICPLGVKSLDPGYLFFGLRYEILEQKVARLWKRIVTDYSQRHLTIENDKVAAIYGIATNVGELCDNDTLVAGLWKNNLLITLQKEDNKPEGSSGSYGGHGLILRPNGEEDNQGFTRVGYFLAYGYGLLALLLSLLNLMAVGSRAH